MLDEAYLGIDIGSVSVSACLIGDEGAVLAADYRMHLGRIIPALGESIKALNRSRFAGVAVTSASPATSISA